MIQKTLNHMSKSLLNHKRIYSLAILFCCTAGYAQITPRTNQPVRITDIREKLVQLALQNPNYEVADRKVAVADYQVKKAKGSWLGAVALQGNLNEFAFKGAL